MLMHSYDFKRFYDLTTGIVQLALIEAQLQGSRYVGTEHLLLGMIAEGESKASQILGAYIGLESARSTVGTLPNRVNADCTESLHQLQYTMRLRRVLRDSNKVSEEHGNGWVLPEHLLIAILDQPSSHAIKLLEAYGVDRYDLREELVKSVMIWQPSQ